MIWASSSAVTCAFLSLELEFEDEEFFELFDDELDEEEFDEEEDEEFFLLFLHFFDDLSEELELELELLLLDDDEDLPELEDDDELLEEDWAPRSISVVALTWAK